MDKQKQLKIVRTIFIILAAITVAAVIALICLKACDNERHPISTEVPGNVIELVTPYAELSLPQAGDGNKPFENVEIKDNSSETRVYKLKAEYNRDFTLGFRIDVREGYEKLAELVKVKVEITTPDGKKVLFDGYLKDFDKEVEHILKANGVTNEELEFTITFYVDGEIPDEYKGQTLIVDFVWTVPDQAVATIANNEFFTAERVVDKTLSLVQVNPEDNLTFDVHDMDGKTVATAYFRVAATHSEDITVLIYNRFVS